MTNANKNKPKKNNKPRRKARGTVAKRISPYAVMLADPCNATLLPGIYGDSEGLLARLKSRHTFASNASAGTSGFILWIADTTGKEDSVTQFNAVSIIGMRTNDGDDNLVNSVAQPAFNALSSNVTAQGFSLRDPADALLDVSDQDNVGLARDARTLSACMRMTYVGAMQTSAGQIAYLENIPLSAVLETSGGTALSVNDLINMSNRVTRMGVDSHEVVYRPSETSHKFRAQPSVATDRGSVSQSGLFSGIDGVAETFVHGNDGLRCFGFAYTGVADATNLTIEFTKNIEWRPRLVSGLPAVPSKQLHALPPVHAAERELDTKHPGWSMRSHSSVGSAIASSAFTGVARTAEQFLERKALPFVEQAAAGALGFMLGI